MNKHYHKVKRQFTKAAKGDVSDNIIGISFALGTFLALLPISVFAISAAVLCALLFKKINKISLFLALLVWNPLWHAIFLYPSLKIGYFILGKKVITISWPYVGRLLTEAQHYMLGISVIAVYMSILSYFVIRLLVKLYRIRQEKLRKIRR